MAENIPAPDNNGCANLGTGLHDMPSPATASEADGSIRLAGIIKAGSGGDTMSDSAPKTGGNDGDIDDKVVG